MNSFPNIFVKCKIFNKYRNMTTQFTFFLSSFFPGFLLLELTGSCYIPLQSRLLMQLLVKLYGTLSSITFTSYIKLIQYELSDSIIIKIAQILISLGTPNNFSFCQISLKITIFSSLLLFLVQDLTIIRIIRFLFLNSLYKQRSQNMDF